jgi:hypothetical protein
MSDYAQPGNRYTAIFLEHEDGTLERLLFDLVRFNVDTDPDAERALVPVGEDKGKVFERVWITKSIPWQQKVGFDGLS